MTRTSPRRLLRAALATSFVAAGSLAGLTLASAPATAAPAARCLDTVYAADNASGNIRPVSTQTGAVGAALYDGNLPKTGTPPTGPGTINQNGIGRGGAYAINANGGAAAGNIVDWTASTEQTRTVTKQTATGVNAIAGSVNPATAAYYYGGYSPSGGNPAPTPTSLVLWSYDRTDATNPAPATRVTINLPTSGAEVPPGGNGDVAFGPDGTLYFVASAGNGETALYRLNAALPTPGAAATFPATSVTELSRTDAIGGTTNATNGIAFASDGFLYLGRGGQMSRVNPITGATDPVTPIVFNAGSGAAVSSTDLGSCANPNTVSITVDAPDGAQNPGDQFTGTIGGGSYDSPGAAEPPTSSFPAGPGGATSDPAIVLPGETYEVGVTPAAGNGPNPYAENYTCTDDVTGEVLAFGSGTSTDLTLPEGTGLSVNCVFSVEEPDPSIDLVKSVSPEQFDSVDDGPLVYTFTVRNTGNTPLDDFALTDELEGLGPITCTPVAEGDTIPERERVPGTVDGLRSGQTVCTAERPITQDEVESQQDIDNSADVDAAPPARFGLARAAATDEVTATNEVTPPAANNDAVGAQLNQTVTLPGATDDTAGTAAIDLAGTRLLGPDGQQVTELAVTGGTFTVVTTGDGVGTIRFVPDEDFTGTASAPYRIVDGNGFTSDATVTVTVRPGPTADVDPAETDQNVDVLVPVLANDVPGPRADGSAGAFDPTTLSLVLTDELPEGSELSDDGSTLTVPGEGTWTAIRTGPDAGQVRFDPEPGFTGPASPVTYVVEDQAGNPTGSTITVEVDAVTPVANGDGVKTPAGTAVTGLDVLENDDEGAASAPLVPGSVVFTSDEATDDGKRLETADGVWTIAPDGTVSFDPAPGFEGPTTVTYQVADANGTTATADVTVVVGQAPLATPDSAGTPQATEVTIDVLGNDVPGDQGTPCVPPGSDTPADCDTGTFDADSVVFPADDQPDGAEVSNGGKRLEVPGQGVWTVQPSGSVVFTPESGFSGPADPVSYQVTDSYDNVATGTISVEVRAIVPSATNDTASTPFNTPVTLAGATNDTPGTDDNGTPDDPSDDVTPALRPGLTVFPSDDQPDGAEVSDDGKTLTLDGVGEYVIGADGSVRFTPEAGFTGPTPPVTYRIEDANGTTDTATLSVTVQAGPQALDDDATTTFATPVRVPVLANDTAGDDAEGATGAWDEDTLRLVLTDDLPEGSELSPDGLTLTVPGEGVWTVVVDGQTSGVRFRPADGFSGPTSPVTYTVDDEFGNDVTATVTVDVLAGPSAVDDGETTPQNVDVTVSPLVNDTPGEPLTGEAAFVVSTLAFDPDGLPTGSSLSPDGLVLTVPDQGVWTIVTDAAGNRTGAVLFDPERAFTGTTDPVGYLVEDSVGNQTGASMTVEVTALVPTAADDVAQTPFQTDVTITVLGNDEAAAASAPLDPTSVFLLDADGDRVRSLEVPGQGTYTVNPVTGVVVFDPVDGFSGTATPVRYVVSDQNGTEIVDPATITVTVRPGPIAVDDDASTPQNTAVTLTPLTNDVPGVDPATGEPGLDGWSQLRFTDGGQPAGSTRSDDGLSLTVPGEGVYDVDPVAGEVTFIPEPQFTGQTTPVRYRALDEFGNPVTAEIRIEVGAVVPVARDDRGRTPYRTPVVLDVLDNDRAGSADAPLDASTVRLVDPVTGEQVRRLVVQGEGTWTVTRDGELRFAPTRDFTGRTAPVDYVVLDANGSQATASATVIVDGPGEALPTSVTTSPGTPVTVDVLDNVTPAPGTDLVPGSVCVLPATITVDGEPRDVQGDPNRCVDSFTLPGVGSWTVEPDGSITFDPAPGFTGTATIDFAVDDTAGDTYTTTLTVDVTDSAAAPGAGAPPAGGSSAGPGGVLPNTGGPALWALLAGLALLTAGGAAVRRSRRRA